MAPFGGSLFLSILMTFFKSFFRAMQYFLDNLSDGIKIASSVFVGDSKVTPSFIDRATICICNY